jgi:hypothetical protein
MLRKAAASPDRRVRSTQIEAALVSARSAGQYVWCLPAERCDRIASSLEEDRVRVLA